MKKIVGIVVGALVGFLVTYVGWTVIVVPGSQGFSESASDMRYTLEMLGLNRLRTPWWVYGVGTLVGAVIGWAITKKAPASPA